MQLALSPVAATEQKMADILRSLRPTFAEKGFSAASMQDLARAAGMSAGNFYRYFPSKAAIIDGMIRADMQQMGQDFAAALQCDDPMTELRRELRHRIAIHQCNEDGCLWAEIHAVAMRSPEIAAIKHAMELQVTAYLVQLFATHTGTPPEQAADAFAPQAALIITLFRAAAMIGPPDTDLKIRLTDQIIAFIEQTLDDITSQARKA